MTQGAGVEATRPALYDATTAQPVALTWSTRRLQARPVVAADADELGPLLDDEALYAHIARPANHGPGLAGWLRQQESRHSPSGAALWLTWILRSDGAGVGYVQATVTGDEAELAWLIGSAWQRRGYAAEAAVGLVTWLYDALGVRRVHAMVPDGHVASERVALHVGMRPTGLRVGPEQRFAAALEPASDNRP